jgi:transposase
VRLRAWLYRVKHAYREALQELAGTIRRGRTWIVHVFPARVTNGMTEGMHKKIKLRKRMAYGLPNCAHRRARILLAFPQPETSPPYAHTVSKSQPMTAATGHGVPCWPA